MERITKYVLKQRTTTFIILLFLAHFLFSNFVMVVPKNFHIIFYKTPNADTQLTCASPGTGANTTQGSSKGFPFSVVTTNGPCDDSSQWLLAGFLNTVYAIVGVLFLVMIRSSIME